MLNILIVDDNIHKINDIQSLLKDLLDKGIVSIDYEMEIKKACSALEIKHFDLLILDVQLPALGNKDGISKSGGVDVLEIINSLDRIKKPSFVIGLTAFDENYKEKIEEFQKYLWLLLKYDKTEPLWRNQIVQKVDYLIRAKNDLLKQSYNEYNFDCAIITAVDTELNSVLNCGLDWKKLNCINDSTIYYESVFIKKEVSYKMILAKQHQMGMVAASTLSTKLIEKFRPRMLCMLGIAAGREGEVDLGDLIVASETWDYGSGKIKVGDREESYILEPEPHQIGIEPSFKEYLMSDFEEILHSIRKEWNKSNGNHQKRDIKIHVGPLASGAAVIQNENIVTEFVLPQNRKLLGLDMETYAVYYAAYNVTKPKPKFLSMKAVCDFANQHKGDQYQEYSAYVSTSFFMSVISDLIELA